MPEDETECNSRWLTFTVGTNSHGIGKKGYFHILFPKVGPAIQFAEVDALTWHAGQYNVYGPGAEWERMPTGEFVRAGLQLAEPLTDDQLLWGGRWIDFCAEHGIPKVHYDGLRFGVVTNRFAGHANHGDLDNQRSDGLTPEEWAAMTSTPKQEERLPVACMVQTETAIALVDGWVVEGLTIEQVGEYAAKGVPGPFARTNVWLGSIQAGPSAARATNADSVVLAATQAVRAAKKGTNPTKDVIVSDVERAVRAALA